MVRVSRVMPSVTAFLLAASVASPAGAGIELISRVPPRHVSDTGAAPSEVQAISADGRYLAFLSDAANLVPGQVDTNFGPDVFVYDRIAGSTELVSRSARSPSTGNAPCLEAAISGDGRFVVFSSLASNLAPGQRDSNGAYDVFLYDRVSGTTELVSHAHDSRNDTVLGQSLQPVISADGRFIAFHSSAADLVAEPPGRHFGDVFLYDRISGRNERVSRSLRRTPPEVINLSFLPAISADGRFVVFLSSSNDLVPGQAGPNGGASHVFLYDRISKKTALISHARSSATTVSNGNSSQRPAISADGSTVVFESSGSDLIPGQQGSSGQSNTFLFHRPTGRTSLVNHASSSLSRAGNGAAGSYAVSADGSLVAFTSAAKDLVSGQTDRDGSQDVFVYQRANGRITLVSGAGGSSTAAANASSVVRGISADGNLVLFQSEATDLVRGVVDGNGGADVFLHDRRRRKTVLVSHGAASDARAGNRTSPGSVLSADGRWVAFQSAATDLVTGAKDFNQSPDIFLDGPTAGRELVSQRAPDLPSDTPPAWSRAESISADGRFVVFTSAASWLVDGQRDRNGDADVFVRDRALGTTLLVSRSAAHPKTTGNAPAAGVDNCSLGGFAPRISADGRFVAFASCATDLVADPAAPAVPDEVPEAFLYDRQTGGVTRIGGGFSSPAAISADGSFLLFVEGGDRSPAFLYDRAAGSGARIYGGPGRASSAVLSADGRFAAFHAWRGGFTTPTTDILLYDRVTGTTTFVDNAGEGAPALSADGRFVAFRSTSTGLVPGQIDAPGTWDRFLYDRLSGTYRLVTHAPGSPVTATGDDQGPLEMALSADGRFLAFASSAAGLIAGRADDGGWPDIFLFDRETGAVAQVSPEDRHSSWSAPRISADGRVVAFVNDAERTQQVLRYDRTTGELVTAADGGSFGPILSADGSALAFTSVASDLVPRDFNVAPPESAEIPSSAQRDVFVYGPDR
jgi:Tol biopolymer transport system component